MLTCDLCETQEDTTSQLFASCGNLYLHMEKRHSQISSLELTPSKIKRENYDDFEENQCKKCLEIFETIDSLNMHAKTVHIDSKENINNMLQYTTGWAKLQVPFFSQKKLGMFYPFFWVSVGVWA